MPQPQAFPFQQGSKPFPCYIVTPYCRNFHATWVSLPRLCCLTLLGHTFVFSSRGISVSKILRFSSEPLGPEHSNTGAKCGALMAASIIRNPPSRTSSRRRISRRGSVGVDLPRVSGQTISKDQYAGACGGSPQDSRLPWKFNSEGRLALSCGKILVAC